MNRVPNIIFAWLPAAAVVAHFFLPFALPGGFGPRVPMGTLAFFASACEWSPGPLLVLIVTTAMALVVVRPFLLKSGARFSRWVVGFALLGIVAQSTLLHLSPNISPMNGSTVLFMAFLLSLCSPLGRPRPLSADAAPEAHRRASRRATLTSLVVLTLFTIALLGLLDTGLSHDPRARGREQAEMVAMEAAFESYHADFGAYPEMRNAAVSQALSGQNSQHKVYMEFPTTMVNPDHLIVDPWGTPYEFSLVESHPEIRSAGPNRKFETGGDDSSTSE